MLLFCLCGTSTTYAIEELSLEEPFLSVNMFYDLENPSKTVADPRNNERWRTATLALLNLLYKTEYTEISYFDEARKSANINGEFLENYDIYQNVNAFHKGIDLYGTTDMLVYAPIEGVLVSEHGKNGETDSYGTVCIYNADYDVTVILDHFFTLEEGLRKKIEDARVQEEETGKPSEIWITEGTPIAYVGNKGTKEVHLHVGLHRGLVKKDSDPKALNEGFIDPRYIVAINLASKSAPNHSTTPSDALPRRDYVLILDVSGSMEGKRFADLKQAAILAVEAIFSQSDQDRVGVITYSSTPVEVAQLCEKTEQETVISAINGLSAGGDTYMSNALIAADELMTNSGDRQTHIVFMSDGLPSEGEASVIEIAQSLHPTRQILSLGFFHGLSGADLINAQSLMRSIANNRGYYHLVADSSLLSNAFTNIISEIVDQTYRVLVWIACPVDVEVTYDGETLSSASESINLYTSFGVLQFEGADNEIKMLRLEPGLDYEIRLVGTDTGTMDYTISYPDEEGNYTDTRAFYGVPVSASTVIQTSFAQDERTTLQIDSNGNGTQDETLSVVSNGVALDPASVYRLTDTRQNETLDRTLSLREDTDGALWQVRHIEDGWYALLEIESAHALTRQSDGQITLLPPDGSASQHWRFVQSGESVLAESLEGGFLVSERTQSGTITLGIDTLERATSWAAEKYLTFETAGTGDALLLSSYSGSSTSLTIPHSVCGLPVTGIKEDAFSAHTLLEYVSIPDSVVHIGARAFQACESLSEVRIGNGVTSIGTKAFENCRNLASVQFGDALETIETYAFSRNENLGSIELPDSLRIIEDSAFRDCGKLTMVHLGNGVEIIESSAFQNCFSAYDRNATYTLLLGDSVEFLGNSAFRGCGGLTEVQMGSGLRVVGAYAFSGLGRLETITLGTNVEILGDYAFSDCQSLHTIWLSSRLVTLGKDALHAQQLTAIHAPADAVNYSSIDGVLLSRDGSILLIVPAGLSGDYVVPDTVRMIREYAFNECRYLSSITIPDAVRMIENYALRGSFGGNNTILYCAAGSVAQAYMNKNSLAYSILSGMYGDFAYVEADGQIIITGYTGSDPEMTIPASIDGKPVTTIGDEAFYANKTLVALTLPDSVQTIGDRSFYDCSMLETVDLGNCVTVIGASAFYSCDALVNLRLGAALQTIGEQAFAGCTNLTSVVLGDNVRSIDDYAFQNCMSLMAITMGNGLETIGNNAFSNCFRAARSGETHTLVIPDSVRQIGDYAFRGCDGLTDIEMGNGVSIIGKQAFAGLSKLVDVTLGNGVEIVGDGAFADCNSLVTVRLGTSVTIIGGEAFHNSKLESVIAPENSLTYSTEDGILFSKNRDILVFVPPTRSGDFIVPESVQTIAAYAFNNCRNLSSVIIPETVQTIENRAFVGSFGGKNTTLYCTEGSSAQAFLDQAKLPYTVISDVVGDYAVRADEDGLFITGYYGSAIELSIPATLGGQPVVGIGEGAFYGNNDLVLVFLPDSVLSIEDQAFYDCNTLTLVTLGQNILTIGNQAFYSCDKLVTAQMGASLVSIGESAFSGCTSMTTLTLPDSLRVIDAYAFSGCNALLSLHLGQGVQTIGINAFADCFSSYNQDTEYVLVIPDSVTEIGQSAFRGCNGLSSITLGNGLITIGNSAFSSLNRITEIVLPDSVETVGDSAFADCNALQQVFLGTSIASVGREAFQSSLLVAFYVSEDNAYFRAVDSALLTKDGETLVLVPPGLSGDYRVPESVSTIAGYAFNNCRNLTSITLSPQVTMLESNALRGSFGANRTVIYCTEGSAVQVYLDQNGIAYELR